MIDFDTYMGTQLAGVEPLRREEMENIELPNIQGIFGIADRIRAYNDFMSDYEEKIHVIPYQIQTKRNFLAELQKDLNAAEYVLDAGCGIGLDVCFLQLRHPEKKFFAYDMSKKNVKKAKERAKQLKVADNFVAAEHDTMPFRIEQFDLIYFDNSLLGESMFLDGMGIRQFLYQRIRTITAHLRIGGKVVNTYAFSPYHDQQPRLWHFDAAQEAGLRYIGQVTIREPDQESDYVGCLIDRFEKSA